MDIRRAPKGNRKRNLVVGAGAVAVLVVEAEGVAEEGGELVGLPRYGLGGGFLALVGVAEGLGGVGDGVLVGRLEGGQALEEVDLAVGGLGRG